MLAQKRMESLLAKGVEDLSVEYEQNLELLGPNVQDYLQQSKTSDFFVFLTETR